MIAHYRQLRQFAKRTQINAFNLLLMIRIWYKMLTSAAQVTYPPCPNRPYNAYPRCRYYLPRYHWAKAMSQKNSMDKGNHKTSPLYQQKTPHLKLHNHPWSTSDPHPRSQTAAWLSWCQYRSPPYRPLDWARCMSAPAHCWGLWCWSRAAATTPRLIHPDPSWRSS